MKRSVMTIGAYERDNFGDSLFYFVAKKYLHRNDLIAPASIMTSVAEESFIDENVLPYAALFDVHDWGCAWVVGGEIGEASLDACLMMDLGEGYNTLLNSVAPEKKRDIRSAISYDGSLSTLGYLPNVKTANHRGKFFVTSVGVSGLVNMPPGIQAAALEGLRRTDYLSVRDTKSYDLCIENGIDQVELIPDLVQTIKLHYPTLSSSEKLPKKYMVVQFNERYYEQASEKKLVEALRSVQKSLQLNIVFVAAGLATGHDSIEIYERLAKRIEGSLVSHHRDPLVIASIIANAQLTISTSLHVRIVSIAYAVPRISLANEKVNSYAETWDSLMPYNVPVDKINTEAVSAVASKKAQLTEIAAQLAEAVDSSVRRHVDVIAADPTDKSPESIQLNASLKFNSRTSRLLIDIAQHRSKGFRKMAGRLMGKRG